MRAFTEEGAASPFSRASEWVLIGDPVRHFEEREREQKAASEAAAAAAVAANLAAASAVQPDHPSEAMLSQLQELGLDRVGAAQALRETGGQSVAAAADWYFTNYKQDRQPERRADDVSWLFS